MNNITLIGRATKDIELKTTQSGKNVVSFTLAVPKRFKRDETNWIPVVAWEKQAEILSKYVAKGNMVCVRGELTSRQYESNSEKRTAYEVLVDEVELIGGKGENSASDGGSVNWQRTTPQFEDVTDEDDLPF